MWGLSSPDVRLRWVQARGLSVWPRAPESERVGADGEPFRSAAGTASMPPGREAPGPHLPPGQQPRAGGGEWSGGRGAGRGRPAGDIRRGAEGGDHRVRRHRSPGVCGNLNIKSSGSGCVKVQNFECDNCRIETEQGTSILQSVKSQKLHIESKGGKVICLGTIYGNIDIHASDKSTVTVNKLQGSSVNISTEDGLLKAKYLYTESSFLSSAAGDISLGSVHGNITLQSKLGNITVDSSSGCLNASTHQGAIDVYVSHLGKVDLKSHKGSILVKVASSLQAYLQLSGKKIDVNSEVHVEEMNEAHKDDGVVITGLLNQASKNEKWIKADAPQGTISFRSQSWFQSLKLLD
ncbi:protein FAM185A isoform X5 [Sus scrofa]|uniref:protein FAM185A isoform X5 n=1 Tax=Sus scrofa TaxID=9823 RepID=UPI0006B18514|nr:protein FAM185A isoform X5 [Sus scrofa]